MIYTADLKKAAGNISYVHVAKYLRDLGWYAFPTRRKNVGVFQTTINNQFYQIDLPSDRSLCDYDAAMYSAIETLAETLQKSVERLILELLNPESDIIRVHIDDPEVEGGSLYVEDAISLYESSKKLLMAAAMDVLNYKLVYFGRPNSQAQDFVDHCRFGQTEFGSYVTSIICPFMRYADGEYAQLTMFDQEDERAGSLTRQITKKIIRSIHDIRESVDKGSLDELIHKEGSISVNFLEAISAMNLSRENSRVELSVQWSPTTRTNILPENKALLTHDYYEPIQAMINKEKRKKEVDEKDYIGRIVKCEAIADAEKRKVGKITMVYLDESNKKMRCGIILKERDYSEAIEAHRYGKVVMINGTLSGKTITEYSEFTVL